MKKSVSLITAMAILFVLAMPVPSTHAGSAGGYIRVVSGMNSQTEINQSIFMPENAGRWNTTLTLENEIYATASGTVKEIRVRSGDAVNTGDVMMVIG